MCHDDLSYDICEYSDDCGCSLFNVGDGIYATPICDYAFGPLHYGPHGDVIVHAWKRFWENKIDNYTKNNFIQKIRSKLKCVFL